MYSFLLFDQPTASSGIVMYQVCGKEEIYHVEKSVTVNWFVRYFASWLQ